MTIEPRTQFRVLYNEFLFRIVDLEILSTRADITKLLGQFAALFAAFSLMSAGGALRILRGGAPASELLSSAWGEEHFLIASTMTAVGLVAILSWDAVLPNQQDVLVLSPLPVPAHTLFLAKLAAIASVLGLTVLFLNVFTGLSYPIALGAAAGGVLTVLRSFAAYWLTMIGAGLFMFFLMLTLQGLASQLLSRRRFLRLSGTLQLGASVSILGVFFLQPPLATSTALASAENVATAVWLPSYWFLGLFQQLNGSGGDVFEPLARRAWMAIGAGGSSALGILLLSYLRTIRKIVEDPDIAPESSKLSRLLRLDGPLTTAVLQFCARTLLRSRQHRVILAWYLGIGFAISAAYGRGLLYGDYGYDGPPWFEVNRPILVATVAMMCFAVVGTRVVFSMPISLRANWLFRTAVAKEAPAYLAATRWSLLTVAVLPCWALSAVLLLAIWPPWPVAGHLLLLGFLGLILTDLCLLGFRKIPFTCSYLPGRANIHVTSGALVLVLLALTDVGVRWELQALRNPVWFAPLATVLALAAAIVRWRVAAATNSREAILRFEEMPASPILTLNLPPDGGSIAPSSLRPDRPL